MIGNSKCQNCDKCFSWYRHPSQSIPKYCSNICRIDHKKAKVTIYGKSNCEQCGKEFLWKRPISQGPAKLCSNQCKPKHLTGRKLWLYKVKLYNERAVKNEEGCWGWKGIIDSNQGYARISVQKSNTSAHRISWEIIHGKIPEGLQINHHCDNRQCTRPDHLYLGTQKENDEDRVLRNRQAKGSKNAASKLNESQVIEIKTLLKSGTSQSYLARKFNVCKGTINNIKTGRNWRNIT